MNRIDGIGELDREYDLCGQVIGCAMKVHSVLGAGFLEIVYRNALTIELRRAGLQVESEKAVTVRYNDEVVGSFAADLLVDGTLIVELKAVQILGKPHEMQLVN